VPKIFGDQLVGGHVVPIKKQAGALARREQILDEALKLIGRCGYYGFGISELAQRCQLTKPGLLHHFGSKDKLLIELVEERDRQRRAEINGLLAPLLRGRTPGQLSRDEVLNMFHEIVVRNSVEPELVRFFVVLAMNQTHPAYDFFMRREARNLKIFSEILEPHVVNPLSSARQFIAMMTGLERQWLFIDQSFDLVAEWDRAANQLLIQNGRSQKSKIIPKEARSDSEWF
jgi:AcrR family transcriptional regulator